VARAGRSRRAPGPAGRSVAFGVWIQDRVRAERVPADLTGALRAADAAVRGDPRHDGDRVSVAWPPRAFVLSRLGPPRRGRCRWPASSWPWPNGWTFRPRSRARARHDAGLISLAAGRHLEAAHLLEQALAEGAEVSPAGRAAGPGRGPGPLRPARTEATAEVRPGGAGSRCAAAISHGRLVARG